MVIHGTVAGARMAPTFVPAFSIPVARERSRWGNQFATVLMAAGKLPASPKAEKKSRHPEAKRGARQRMCNGRQTPYTHKHRIANARSQTVHQTARANQSNGVGQLKWGED